MFSFLFVDSERVWRGGQVQLLDLMEGLHKRGHKVHLICHPKTKVESRAREIGLFTHPMRIRSEVGLIALARLFRVLRQVRPEILAFNTPKPILIGTLASQFTSVGVRIIFRRVDFPLRRNFFTRLKYTWGIDCIVAISNAVKSRLETGGVPPSKIRVIYEGIDLSLFPKTARSSAHPPDGFTRVGTVAHLSPEKGVRYLIEAAALIPSVQDRFRFIVVGEGACLGEFKEKVRNNGLESCFQFAGFCSDPSPHLNSFDIFVLPSLSEGLSSAIIEAMAYELPVIGSRVGGIPELVNPGENGLLVPPADPAALAQAIQQLADNPEVAMQMGRRGRERVEKRHTLERKIVETEKLCGILLKASISQPGSAYV
jgi:glycosyltransferase involved in cell wall biosynthesis